MRNPNDWNDPAKKQASLERAWTVEKIVIQQLEELSFVAIHRGKGEQNTQHGPRLCVPAKVHAKPLPLLDIEVFWPYRGYRLVPHGLPHHFFLDAKEKLECSFYHKKMRWQSAIDEWCWESYGTTEKLLMTPVWVAHVIASTPQEIMDKRSVPPEHRPPPSGIFLHPVLQPISDRYGSKVFWGIENMLKIAEYPESLKEGKAA